MIAITPTLTAELDSGVVLTRLPVRYEGAEFVVRFSGTAYGSVTVRRADGACLDVSFDSGQDCAEAMAEVFKMAAEEWPGWGSSEVMSRLDGLKPEALEAANE